MPSLATIAWLAGYLEGEGCFHLDTSRRRPVITVRSTDEDVIKRVAALWGTNVHYYDNRPGSLGKKRIFGTQTRGARGGGWMMTLYAFLGTRRRAKVREVLSGWRKS